MPAVSSLLLPVREEGTCHGERAACLLSMPVSSPSLGEVWGEPTGRVAEGSGLVPPRHTPGPHGSVLLLWEHRGHLGGCQVLAFRGTQRGVCDTGPDLGPPRALRGDCVKGAGGSERQQRRGLLVPQVSVGERNSDSKPPPRDHSRPGTPLSDFYVPP